MRVVARFAYWQEGFEEIPPDASYIIVQSDLRRFPVGSNVSGESLMAAGVPLPVTPTLRTWINAGCPVYRGGAPIFEGDPPFSIIDFFRPCI